MIGKHARPSTGRKLRAVAAVGAVAAGGTALATTSAHAATQSQWDAIASCESSGRWDLNWSSDGLSVGGLQFIQSSWTTALNYLSAHGVDISNYPKTVYQGMPNVPTKEQQLYAGEALLAIQGPNAWVCNWGGHSSAGALTDDSMFEGGPVPAGIAPAPPAAPTPKPVESTPPPAKHDETYTVVPGDYLSKIAAEHGISDWHTLYNANKDVVGCNPDLIYPGQVLDLP